MPDTPAPPPTAEEWPQESDEDGALVEQLLMRFLKRRESGWWLQVATSAAVFVGVTLVVISVILLARLASDNHTLLNDDLTTKQGQIDKLTKNVADRNRALQQFVQVVTDECKTIQKLHGTCPTVNITVSP